MPPSKTVHPYIPNSAPEVREQMLREVGASSIEDFYEDVPLSLRFQGRLNLPEPLPSEHALRRHVEGLLHKNITPANILIFWEPAVTSTRSRLSAMKSTNGASS